MKLKTLPFLLIVPVKLIKQWKLKICWITLFIIIYKYYEDYWAKSVLNKMMIKKQLIKKHEFFWENSANIKTVILTSYDTMQRWYRLCSQFNWHMKFGKWQRTDVKDNYYSYDEWWSGELVKCFDIIIFDETHFIKNLDIEVHSIIAWLKMRFNLCITAISLITDSRNLTDYLHLLQSADTATM